uniref:Telomere-associated protein Rif1 N-terminal domain-containing protein n=1 Tax=Eptatretus burgeri TaxID=7764 RepID=A0A8C4NGR7_EPTBU
MIQQCFVVRRRLSPAVMATRGVLVLLDTLIDNTVTDDDRVDALLTLTDRLRTVDVHEKAFIDKVYQLFECCQTYLSGSNVELKLACLQTLGYCVFHEKLVEAVPVKLLHDLMALLLKTITVSTEKNMLTKGLWVLAQQNFPPEVVESKVATVMDALENVACRAEQYAGVQYEVSKILGRLQGQAPGVVAQHVVRWAPTRSAPRCSPSGKTAAESLHRGGGCPSNACPAARDCGCPGGKRA